MNTISKLLEKLKDQEYRRAFVVAQINIGIPFQIRALMKAPSRKWTQKDLAARTGMLQPRISAMLKPGATRPNIETLRRLADAFDCGLQVRFVPFTDLVTWSQRFSPDDFEVPDYYSQVNDGSLDALALERKPLVPNSENDLGIEREEPAGALLYTTATFHEAPPIQEHKVVQFPIQSKADVRPNSFPIERTALNG
ncbi:MAG: helix-turn-helix transcriptional regulator [Bryobacteraceae bacterium]